MRYISSMFRNLDHLASSITLHQELLEPAGGPSVELLKKIAALGAFLVSIPSR